MWTLVADDGGDRQLYAEGEQGMVVEGDVFYPPYNLQAIYARGGWQEPSTPDRSDEVNRRVTNETTKGGG